MSALPEDLRNVARALGAFRAPWWIAGGWAIDLHLGRVSRAHHDIDVTILRRDQEGLHAALNGFELKKIIPDPAGVSGRGTIAPWDLKERLELPIHQANAYAIGKIELSFQIMFEESDGAEWWFRRDPRVRRQLNAIGCVGSQEIPYLSPEIELLFKAKTMRSYDQSDFETVLPRLTREPRGWLRGALAIAHPNHPWIARLD